MTRAARTSATDPQRLSIKDDPDEKTFVDVLLELPVDTTLREFLTSHGLPLPDAFTWDDTPETSQSLVDAVKDWADITARDRMIANLMASVELGDAAGKQAMYEAASPEATAFTGLPLCYSDIHRSFWLYCKHRTLFERAYDINFWEHRGTQAQQYDLDLKRQPNGAEHNLAALREAISAFYKREMQCGDGSVAYLVERNPGVFLLSVHIKDMATLRLEFEGSALKRRVGNPNIHMVLEYAQATGVVRTLVRGGEKYQQMLVDAFAEHILGTKVSGQRIRSSTLDLSMLRTGFDAPAAFEDGFSMVQLKALTLLSPDGVLKIECTAMQSGQQRSVHELLREKLPGPLEGRWTVTSAQINLYYPPEQGRTRNKMVSIEVTSKGRLNLHKFDARMQAQLEGYLVSVGILQRGQTLSAQELPPQEDALSPSAFGD
ncbi:hypothetical protein AGMMS50225_19310 [Betaproteobacteria bacterium]|nr:hypothetical protein AGMMS50225_19310 [Betaproteobacteria bacterium]